MPDLADDVQVPRLRIGRLVLEVLERNANLHLVAVVSYTPFGAEDEILAEIGRDAPRQRRRPAAGQCLTLLDDGAVHLDTQRIDAENVRLPVVVEGAEQDLDVVVRRDLVAIGESGVRGAVLLEGTDAEVDGGRRVPDEDLGGVGGGDPVLGRELGEAGENRRLLPHRLLERAVDGDVRLDARDGDAGLVGAATIDEGRDGRGENDWREHAPRWVAGQDGAMRKTSKTPGLPSKMFALTGRPATSRLGLPSTELECVSVQYSDGRWSLPRHYSSFYQTSRARRLPTRRRQCPPSSRPRKPHWPDTLTRSSRSRKATSRPSPAWTFPTAPRTAPS